MMLELHFTTLDYDVKIEFHETAVDFLCKFCRDIECKATQISKTFQPKLAGGLV
jgi:hypothetical protein